MRDIKLDSIKGILMLLTVFGPALELVPRGTGSALYRIIYSFHMPAFLFISGYLARWNPRKLVRFYLPLFLFSQLFYIVFDFVSTGSSSSLPFGFLTPYWHLWYLAVLILCKLTLPLLSKVSGKGETAVFVCTVLLSLLFPLIRMNVYFLSLGRFFAFLPFFTVGYFCKREKSTLPNLALGVPFTIIFTLSCDRVTLKMLYGSFAYSDITDMEVRAALSFFAFGWISLFFDLPAKEGILTFIGKNTLPTYILHGFFMRVMKLTGVGVKNEITALLIALALCLSLSSLENFSNINVKIIYNRIKQILHLKTVKIERKEQNGKRNNSTRFYIKKSKRRKRVALLVQRKKGSTLLLPEG